MGTTRVNQGRPVKLSERDGNWDEERDGKRNENGTKQTRESEKKNRNESVRIEAESKRDGAYFICMNSYTICEWNINDVRFFGIDALIHYNSFDMKIGRSVGLLVWWFCIIYTFGLYGFSFCQMWGCCYHWRCFRRLISIKAKLRAESVKRTHSALAQFGCSSLLFVRFLARLLSFAQSLSRSLFLYSSLKYMFLFVINFCVIVAVVLN